MVNKWRKRSWLSLDVGTMVKLFTSSRDELHSDVTGQIFPLLWNPIIELKAILLSVPST